MVVAPLDRKLFRDLWRVRGQALAIAFIVASGVAVLVMSLTAMQALSDSGRAYYDRYGFAEVFTSVKRAPERLVRTVSELESVQLVESRVVHYAMLDMPGLAEPVIGRLTSLPAEGDGLLNRLVVRAGRLPVPERPDEVVVAEPFAEAHGLALGDRFGALLNGRRRDLEVVGVALSPEFVYAIGPGALMPDPRHYGVLWMSRRTLAAVFDLEGAFNDLTLTLHRGASADTVIPALDAVLAPYGSTGAYARREQISNWFLQNEIEQLESMATILPTIFLAVAAFLTNMVLARLVFMERAEIGLLKAFGYPNRTVVWHYAKLVVVLSLVGLALGWAAGFWLGRWVTGVYAQMFRFPELVFQPSASVYAISLVVSVGSSLIGVVSAARYAGGLPPAEAMRPPQPPAFRHQTWSPRRLLAWFDQPTRIVFRQVFRKPLRSLLTSAGLAASVALLVVSMQWLDALDYMIDDYFHHQQRQDMTLGFAEARPMDVVRAVERLPGVLAVEPMRSAAVRFSNGHRNHRGAITGVLAPSELLALTDAGGRAVAIPLEGLLLSETLADKLGVTAGDVLGVEVLEGRRTRTTTMVAAVFETVVGTPAYMDLEALNSTIDEPRTTNMLQVIVDEALETELYASLQSIASVAGVTLKRAATDMFEETIGETMLIMVLCYIAFASTMAFGMVYNSLRIALSERGRELATLRVLGFRPGEVSYMLFAEAGLLVAVGLPLGCAAGWGLAWLISASFDTELFRVPVVIEPATYGLAVVIALGAMVPSVMLIQRRLSRLDLIAVLKTRE